MCVELALNALARDAMAGGRVPLRNLESIGHASLLRVYPTADSISAPDSTPQEVAHFFLQAKRSIRENPDAAVLMARRTLEVATLLQLEVSSTDESERNSFRKLTLFKRIDALNERRRITPLLAEWAHSLRLDGNEAAHGMAPVDPADAAEAVDFAEVFLTYVFTMPARIAARRIAREPAADEGNAAAPTQSGA
ncbi:MAG: DUF4145 domain-containing protein [Pseudomonadales bacterium]|nr:DUF4145 domain-containing protein [Pseudomonadales bacterium]